MSAIPSSLRFSSVHAMHTGAGLPILAPPLRRGAPCSSPAQRPCSGASAGATFTATRSGDIEPMQGSGSWQCCSSVSGMPACSHSVPVVSRGKAMGRVGRRAAPPCGRLPPPQAQMAAQQEASTSTSGMEAAAERLAAFCEVLQPEGGGLTDGQLAGLLSSVPGLMQEDPAQVRGKLDALCAGTGLDLVQAAGLMTHVPAAWNRNADVLVARLVGLGQELGISAAEAGTLLTAVPPLFAINTPSIIKDKFDSLALRLGLPTPMTVNLVIRQPLLWAVPPQHIQSGVPRLCERLGLSTEEAVALVGRVPVVLVLEERLMNMQLGALSSVLGVPVSSLIELLGRCLGLVAVPAEVLGANLANLASALGVREESALDLVMQQPALLAAQLPSLATCLDVLQAALPLDSRGDALHLLCRQPALLYDLTVPAINDKLDALAALFQVPVAEVRAQAAQQPTLLLASPYTLKAALSVVTAAGGQEATPSRCLELLTEDPGAFMSLAQTSETMGQWTSRLGLSEEQVASMAAAQPALLEMSPTTVKARLESLAALFGIPVGIVAQLVTRHPALATIPPNVVITRVKGMSLALGSTMQTIGVLVAKAPAVLGCAVVSPGELNRDLKPYTSSVQEVVAAYEFYTMDWLQRSIKDVAPQRMRSFTELDRRL